MDSSSFELAKIERNGNKAEDWLVFINKVKRESANYDHIVKLYEMAACVISPDDNKKNITYARLLVELAKLQGLSSPEDARDTFRVARCNVRKFAIVYLAWAQFELSQGNWEKCKSILNKARTNAAEPIELLNQALQSCEQGNPRLLDEETEELAFTGVLSQPEKPRVKVVIPTLQSDSELTQEKLTTVDSSSLSRSMNLSVRKSARRGLKIHSLGPPMRGKHVSPLEDVEERIFEGEEQTKDDNLDDFKVLDYTSSPLIHDKSLSENNSDPSANNVNHENTPPQVSLETNKPDMGSTVLALHEDVARSAVHNKCHDNYSVNQNPPRHLPHQSKVNIDELQDVHGRHEDIYSQEKSNVGYSKQTVHQNLGYPNQEAASYQGFPNSFATNNNEFVKREVPVNQIFLQGHTAIENTTMFVNGRPYLKLDTIGRGGSSQVVRAFDGQRLCAVKCVSLRDADDFIIQSYINEISMLKRVQGSDHIIKLYDWEQKKNENSIVLVLECGSIDLAAFLRKNRSSFTQTMLTAYWKQMLEAVNVIHNQGIIHSDLKPANFLFVEGKLKLIDFGIAMTIQTDQTSIQRDTQVGTLNFMSPESFQDISSSSQLVNPATGRSRPCTKIGRPSDVWSLGCILYNMVYGRTPFQHITNQAIKLQCIMDENYAIEFPPVDNQQLLDVVKGCLIRNPRKRYTIQQLLKHPFLSLGKQDPYNEEQLFNCLLELTQTKVNTPRSIRVASKSICEQLRSGTKIDLSSVQAKKQPLCRQLYGLNVQELPQSQGSMEKPTCFI